eukprot:NODE_1203_length_1836_cov_524.833625_g1141_i0.p1 GENE.NODE_1203_length_1836_cov_524.833625_g1141_i0~~NODE_1203_length_1836_cov_524.833625_g1141_i0.p1  ORF type:complete len:548 (+),score=179.88 NODE_1203_length_1836_cov_524.833625_g1141_i0:55-1644(+)
MQQGVVEPVEEVGYKNRPPLLEEVSVEGPFRTPIPHALDTLEQRERIEEDYNWFRYSKFALPWLLVLLALFATLFTLTAFEQVGDLHGLRDGYPAYYQLQQTAAQNKIMEGSHDRTEGGMKKVIRNLRIACVWHAFVGAFLALVVLLSKPRPPTRKMLHFLCAFLLFVAFALAIAALVIAETWTKRAVRCPEMFALTNERCDNRQATAMISLILDFVLLAFCFTGCIALAYATAGGHFKLNRRGWRQQERDSETEAPPKNPLNIKAHHVRRTWVQIVVFALVCILLLAIMQAVLIVILHQNHTTVTLRGHRGRSTRFFRSFDDAPFEAAGWSARNTRLRYAVSSTGIITVLLNLLPWRSRVVAYLFAFVYLLLCIGSFVIFALDASEIREGRDGVNCPTHWMSGLPQDLPDYAVLSAATVNCINSPYIATIIMDMFAAVAALFYLLNEFLIRYKSVHSQRKYPWFQIRKIETELDSRRPVRCEVTSEVMTAAEYYYRHRFLTEAEMLAQGSDFDVAAPYGNVPYDQPIY